MNWLFLRFFRSLDQTATRPDSTPMLAEELVAEALKPDRISSCRYEASRFRTSKRICICIRLKREKYLGPEPVDGLESRSW
jgi:hypothetical protein